jgi:hypothetical protein
LSQIWDGGPHWASELQPEDVPQWPVVESQAVPPVHAGAPSCPQPGTQVPAWQILVGAPHWLSTLQPAVPEPSQRPEVELQLCPAEHWIDEPAVPQPGTHWPPWHTVAGGLQEKSAVQLMLLAAEQVPLTQCWPPVHWLSITQSAQSCVVVSQCFPIALQAASEVQERAPLMHTPVAVLHFWSAGQAESLLHWTTGLHAPNAVSQNWPAGHALSFLQPGCAAEAHLPSTHCSPVAQSRLV